MLQIEFLCRMKFQPSPIQQGVQGQKGIVVPQYKKVGEQESQAGGIFIHGH
jgi:hypothetical protein